MSQIVPGGVSPMMAVLGGDPIDELARIERAVRFRPPASTRAGRLDDTAPLPQRITFSWWQKRTDLGTTQCVYGGGRVGTGYAGDYFGFNASNQFQIVFDDSVNAFGPYASTEVFRDVLSWEHIVLAFDTTQATQADRMKLWRNNRAVTISNGLALNVALYFLSNSTSGVETIGARDSTYYPDQFFGGLLAHFAVVVGQALTPSSFGRLHPLTRQWRPRTKAEVKAVVDASGHARSSFRPMDDNTSLSTLFADISVNSNNMTATNFSLTAGATYDSLLDTPTTNYCTLNPLNVAANAATPSDGNLKVTGTASVNHSVGTMILPDQQSYFEGLILTVGSTVQLGVRNLDTGNTYVYDNSGNKVLAGVSTGYGATLTTSDRFSLIVDPVSLTLEFFKQTGGVGAFVSQGVIASAFPAGRYVPFVYVANGSVVALNFGQQPLANSSVPATAKSLCAKNLPRPTGAARNPATAFVGVLGSSANILTNLATARAGWADYIDIVKRRDSGEGWRLSFSDDPGQAMDWQSSGGKFAYPALAGSSYVAYSLRVGAAYGVATGRFVHPGGTSVIADGLGKTRKAVILTNEAGSAWYFYHPELTAGKLLYLSSTVAETPDTAINSVTSSGFSITVAAGTWRWIALAETDWLKLFKYVSNNVADGPFDNRGIAPIFGLFRQKVNTDNFWVIDAIRESGNPRKASLFTNLSSGEDTSQDRLDYTSAGPKIRASAGSNPNVGTTDYIGIYIADAVFRYSNAR